MYVCKDVKINIVCGSCLVWQLRKTYLRVELRKRRITFYLIIIQVKSFIIHRSASQESRFGLWTSRHENVDWSNTEAGPWHKPLADPVGEWNSPCYEMRRAGSGAELLRWEWECCSGTWLGLTYVTTLGLLCANSLPADLHLARDADRTLVRVTT